MRLEIQLLGNFEVRLDGKPVTGFESIKVRALLAYLASEAGRPQNRNALAGLLWPDWPEEAAHKNLRHTLYSLRKLLQDIPCIEADRQWITLNLEEGCQIDVLEFDKALVATSRPPTTGDRLLTAVGGLSSAVAMYRGPFLEGFTIDDSPAFEEWVLAKRQYFNRHMYMALGQLANDCEQTGEFDQGLAYARKQIELEPLLEEGHRQVIRLLGLLGLRSDALLHYESIKQALQKELNVEPSAETTRLIELIRHEAFTPQKPLEVLAPNEAFQIERTTLSLRQRESAPLHLPSDKDVNRRDIIFSTEEAAQGKTGFLQNILVESEQQRAFRNRQNMLHLVWNTWIEGVLKKSLFNEVLLELGMETKPDAIEHPWDLVIQMPGNEPQQIAPYTTMLELFDQSNGSLLILGESGSGKTTMLLELCREAIVRAKGDPFQPIPVVFNLSSWKPEPKRNPGKAFAMWLVDELKGRYSVPYKISRPWIENDALMLLLDGLDEVREEYRETCIVAINEFSADHAMPVVACSRIQEYEASATQLHFHLAVLIQSLTDQQVNTFFHSLGVELTSIYEALQSDQELREFVHTPLILSTLVLAFQNATQKDWEALTESGDLRAHLYNAYIAKMLKRRGVDQRFTPEKTLTWLSWLAREMGENKKTIIHVEDIQPSWLPLPIAKRNIIFGSIFGVNYGLIYGLIYWVLSGDLYYSLIGGLVGGLVTLMMGGLVNTPEDINTTDRFNGAWKKARNGLVAGLFFGIAFGIYDGIYADKGFISGLLLGLLAGLIGGSIYLLIEWLSSGLGDASPTDKLNWSWTLFLKRLRFGLIIGLIGGLLAGMYIGMVVNLFERAIVGVMQGVIFGAIIGLIGGFRSTSVNERSRPGEGIQSSLKSVVSICLILGLGFGFGFGLSEVLIFELSAGQYGDVINGLHFGLKVGISAGMFAVMFYGGEFLIKHFISRWFLYHKGYLPWNLISFLEYAAERIFLRQVGGGYIFIHRMLMEHFAAMWGEKALKK